MQHPNIHYIAFYTTQLNTVASFVKIAEPKSQLNWKGSENILQREGNTRNSYTMRYA